MSLFSHKTQLAVFGAVLGLSGSALAQKYDSRYDSGYGQGGYGVQTLDERVGRLEKRLSGETMMETLNRLESLQKEVSKLRGQVEELSNSLRNLKKQQQETYTDLDQRLQRLQAPTPPAGFPAAGTAPGEGGGIEGALPEATASMEPVPTVDPAARQSAYQKAFDTLKESKYPEAIQAFREFIAYYPSGDYVDNAHYWLGEAYYVTRDFPAARDTFNRLITNFPQSAKVADAQLKMGFIDYETGQFKSARQILSDVVKRYPDSSAAHLAEKRLQKMNEENR